MGSKIQFRRKAVNVIEDSDSDAGGPVKKTSSLDHTDKVYMYIYIYHMIALYYQCFIIKYLLNYKMLTIMKLILF